MTTPRVIAAVGRRWENMTLRCLTTCFGLLLLAATPAAARDGRLRQSPLPLGKGIGNTQLLQRADGSAALLFQTSSGLFLSRSADGRRYGRRVRIARSGDVEDFDMSLGRRGRVLVAWTVDDGSVPEVSENRDDDACCTRPWVGGTTASGKAIKPRRLKAGGSANTGSLRAEIIRGRAIVTAASTADTEYEGPARVWTLGRRGWSAPRRFAGRAEVETVRPVRLGGRTVLFGVQSRGSKALVRRWPLRGGRARTLGTLSRNGGFSGLVASGRALVGLVVRYGTTRASGFSAVRVTSRAVRKTPLRRGLLHWDTGSDLRGTTVVAGVASTRAPVVAQLVTRGGRPGRRFALGRFGVRVEEFDFGVETSLSRRGTVAVWGSETLPVDRHPLVRLQRTRDGRVTRARTTLPGSAALLFGYADRRGRSVALVNRGGRLWLVR